MITVSELTHPREEREGDQNAFYLSWVNQGKHLQVQFASLQCRRILGVRNLVRVGNCVIAVAAIFDFMTVEDWGE